MMPCKQGKGWGLKDIEHPDFHMLLAASCSVAWETVQVGSAGRSVPAGEERLGWEARPSELCLPGGGSFPNLLRGALWAASLACCCYTVYSFPLVL